MRFLGYSWVPPKEGSITPYYETRKREAVMNSIKSPPSSVRLVGTFACQAQLFLVVGGNCAHARSWLLCTCTWKVRAKLPAQDLSVRDGSAHFIGRKQIRRSTAVAHLRICKAEAPPDPMWIWQSTGPVSISAGGRRDGSTGRPPGDSLLQAEKRS